MRVLVANIEDVFREAAARWTLIAYFFLSTIFLIIFASAINLDIVDGALAGAQLFGQDMRVRGTIDLEQLVLGFESVFSVILYALCTFMAVFATAHLVPRMQDKGTVDLYLARPVSRTKLLLSRYLAGLLLAGMNILYLIGAIWLIVMWKTKVVHPRFFLAGAIILFVVATLMAFAFLIGVITSSTAVSIMMTYGIALFAIPLAAHDRIAAAVSKEWQAWVINTLYWVLPKIIELGGAVIAYVGGDKVPQRFAEILTPTPFLTTAAFAVVCLVLSCWVFNRKEF
jgi:ABC-2 type transport system permease protein